MTTKFENVPEFISIVEQVDIFKTIVVISKTLVEFSFSTKFNSLSIVLMEYTGISQ
ncbi:hypothetical protein ACIN8IBEIGE_180009 [Acinetobacter sp. 8I-beige]|nr:hypothetical protein ACIN8IBEIGE_180009 [Acinetobacter sp. 8I-beige]